MTNIIAPTRKVKSKQVKTSLPFCYTNHKDPSPINRLYRQDSTRTIGLTRPSVLKDMPLSCHLVYDILRTLDPGNGVVQISQRDLADITRYSKTQVRRALRRLQGAKILRLVEKGKGQRKTAWYLRWNSQKSFPQFSGPLTTREVKKELKPTKDKSPFSIESFKNTPENQQLNRADKRRLSFIARRSCQLEVVSTVLSVLWQRDAVAGVWLEAIRGLRNLSIDERATELVWRARKGIAALIGGLDREGFEAIMEDKPANEEEAVEREVAEIDRRLQGLTKWGCTHGVTSWFVEKRAELEKERYRTGLPCGICTDGFFARINEPQPQPRRLRGRIFHLSDHYTAKRQPLTGEALQKKKAIAVKALREL